MKPIIYLSAVVLFLIHTQGSALAEDAGWNLDQKSSYCGEVSFYIFPTGIRLLAKKMNVVVVSSAPGWKLTMYNEKSHCYYQTSINEWANPGLAKAISSKKIPLKIGAGVIAGQNVAEYTGQGPKTTGENRPGDTTHVWVASNINMPGPVSKFLSKMYRIPELDVRGCPMRIDFVDKKGTKTSVLDTLACHRASLPEGAFTMPKGYRRVSDEVTVFMGAGDKDSMADLLKELSTDPKAGKGHAGASSGLSNEAQAELNAILKGQGSPSTAVKRSGASSGLPPQGQQKLDSLLKMYGKSNK